MSVFTNEVIVGNVVGQEVPVSGPITNTELRASAVPVSGPLTDAQLRALAIPVSVSGSVSVSNFPATQPVSGSVSVSNFPATQPVSGTFWQATQPVSGPLTDTQLRATPVPISGTVSTTPSVSSSAVITRVATAASSTLLLATNANRKKAIVMTETGTGNYLAFAATASITAYTYLMGSTTVLEITNYTGPISMIRASGSGNVQVTELV